MFESKLDFGCSAKTFCHFDLMSPQREENKNQYSKFQNAQTLRASNSAHHAFKHDTPEYYRSGVSKRKALISLFVRDINRRASFAEPIDFSTTKIIRTTFTHLRFFGQNRFSCGAALFFSGFLCKD